MCCRSTLYNLQAIFVNRIIYSFWIRMQSTLLERFQQSGRPISITGDGQYDSPGFSARYCFYTLVETTSRCVLDFYVAEKTQVEYSGKMEPFAAKILMARLHKKRVRVRVCTTNRSTQLKSLFREINDGRKKRGMLPILHCFDIWHIIKAITKDLFVASKLKKCQTLGSWIRSIRNMLWFCFASCKGNPLLLREMILSIPRHVGGVHSFPENKMFKRCLHGELPARRSKPWLKDGSLSMKKLVQAIHGRKDCRLKDIPMMTEFQHTSINESINALHNVYLPKSNSYGHQQALVRGCLTAIDHNYNADRKPLLDHDGEEMYNVVSTRDGLVYTAKTIKEPKNTEWRKEILGEVLQVRMKVSSLKRKSVAKFFQHYLPTILIYFEQHPVGDTYNLLYAYDQVKTDLFYINFVTVLISKYWPFFRTETPLQPICKSMVVSVITVPGSPLSDTNTVLIRNFDCKLNILLLITSVVVIPDSVGPRPDPVWHGHVVWNIAVKNVFCYYRLCGATMFQLLWSPRTNTWSATRKICLNRKRALPLQRPRRVGATENSVCRRITVSRSSGYAASAPAADHWTPSFQLQRLCKTVTEFPATAPTPDGHRIFSPYQLLHHIWTTT